MRDWLIVIAWAVTAIVVVEAHPYNLGAQHAVRVVNMISGWIYG